MFNNLVRLGALLAWAVFGVGQATISQGEGIVEHIVLADFEQGGFGCYQWGPSKFTTVGATEEKAHGGGRSLKLSWTFGEKADRKTFAAVGHRFGGTGSPQTFTFWIHAEHSGAGLELHMVDARGEVFIHALGLMDWQGWREFIVPVAPTPVHFGGNNDGKIDPPVMIRDILVRWREGAAREGTMYIDDVSMATLIPPYGDASIGYDGPKFVQENARTTFPFSISGYRNPPDMEFTFTVEAGSEKGEKWGKAAKQVRLKHKEGVGVEVVLPVGTGREAALRATLTTPDGTVVRQATAGGIYVLPDVSRGEFEPHSVFGVCNSYPSAPWEVGALKWRRMGINYHPDRWGPDVVFEDTIAAFEKVLAFSEANKVMIMPILNMRDFQSAYQPGGRTEGDKEAFSLARWADWVYRVVGRFKGRVKYWEISNEPDLSTTPEQYTALAKTAYVMAKRADPGCFIGAFGVAGVNLPFIESCLKLGIGDYFDFVTVHPYQWSHSFNEELLLGALQSVEELLKRYDCSRPAWISEIGWPTHPKGGSPVEVQGDIVAQLYLTLAGVEKHKAFWYTLGDWGAEATDPEGSFGLFDAGGRPKPSFYSYYVVSKALSSARSLGRAELPDGFLGWRYLLRSGRLGTSVWRPAGEPQTVRLRVWGLDGTRVEKLGMDLSREALESTDGYVELTVGSSPVILVYRSKVQFKLKARPPLAISPKTTNPVFLAAAKLAMGFPGQQMDVPFSVINGSDNPVTGDATLELADGLGSPVVVKGLIAREWDEAIGCASFIVPSGASNGTYRLNLKFPGCRDLPVDLEVASHLSIDVAPVDRLFSAKDVPLTVRFTNRSREKLNGRLTMTAVPANVSGDPTITIELEPGQSLPVKRMLEALPSGEDVYVELHGQVGTQQFDFRRAIDSVYVHRAEQIAVDADLNEWQAVPGFWLNRIDQIQRLKTWWSGPEDLSGKVQVQWDENFFYFAADVTDDVHCQRSVGGSTWLGDGFQISFEVDGRYAYELCLAHTAQGPQLYALRTITGQIGDVQGAKVAARRAGEHTYYEVAIPWSAIPPLRGAAGQAIRFDFILNESDALTRVGWLECRPGIGSGKGTQSWYNWRLGDEPAGK